MRTDGGGVTMAGSYGHIVNEDGTYRGCDLIENGGDAVECIEHCYLMIQHLSGGSKEKIAEAVEAAYATMRERGFVRVR
jgi:hypothetical protein